MSEPKVDEAAQAKLLEVGSLFTQLARDPKHRKKVLGIIKEASPDTPIPELDLEHDFDERVSARVGPVLEENKKLVGRVEDLERTLARTAVRDAANLSEEELVEVEKFATEHGITKADKAIGLYREIQSGRPRSTVPANPDVEFTKEIRGAMHPARAPVRGNILKQAVIKQANRVLTEMRGGRVR